MRRMMMATIVELKKTGERFFLLGVGYGMYRSERNGIAFPSPSTQEGNESVVGLCDEQGQIHFYKKDSIRVIEIDNIAINRFSDELKRGLDDHSFESCPACFGKVLVSSQECPHCGLALLG